MDDVVKGWRFFRFILTPEELARVLEPFHLVVHNAHVPADYRETPPEAFLEPYQQLYAKLAAGEQLLWERDWPLLHHTGITTDLSHCPYGREHLYEGRRFRSPAFSTPCAALAPFALTIDTAEHRTDLRRSYMQFPQNVVGLEAAFPKQLSRGDDSWQSAEELPGYADFLLLKERVGTVSHGLRFDLKDHTYRPAVQISAAAQADFPRFYAVSQFSSQ